MDNLEDLYNNAVKLSRSLIEDVRFSRNVNLEQIKSCSDQICRYMTSNTNILILLNTVQDKYPYLYSHPVNVAFISYMIGKWLHLKASELSNLASAGLLHDIGKAKVRDSILNKPDKLSDMEMETVRMHPVIGYKILGNIEALDTDVLLGVLSHHERQDGSGYPKGLRGNQISLFGRIIAVADVFDAITSTKAYRAKSSPFEAVDEIQDESFRSLDPQICQIFMNRLSDYYCGNRVRLNNEQIGDIIYVNPEEKTRPLIRCENRYLNLARERDIKIVEIIHGAEMISGKQAEKASKKQPEKQSDKQLEKMSESSLIGRSK